MGISHSEAYAAAGVNIEAGYEGVKLMKKHVQRTMIPGVVSDLGGFGGLGRRLLLRGRRVRRGGRGFSWGVLRGRNGPRRH